MTNVVSIQYDQMKAIGARFRKESERVAVLYTLLVQKQGTLRSGSWIGRGSDSFNTEMVDDVLPALRRLIDALNLAGDVSDRIVEIIVEAEQEAAGPFDSVGDDEKSAEDSGSGGGSGGGSSGGSGGGSGSGSDASETTVAEADLEEEGAAERVASGGGIGSGSGFGSPMSGEGAGTGFGAGRSYGGFGGYGTTGPAMGSFGFPGSESEGGATPTMRYSSLHQILGAGAGQTDGATPRAFSPVDSAGQPSGAEMAAASGMSAAVLALTPLAALLGKKLREKDGFIGD